MFASSLDALYRFIKFICKTVVLCFLSSLMGGNVIYFGLTCLLILLLKVCERSLSGSGTGPNPAAAAQFVRAETLPSGYLIRPCEGGGSIIHIVDHLNLEVLFRNTELMYIFFFSDIH